MPRTKNPAEASKGPHANHARKEIPNWIDGLPLIQMILDTLCQKTIFCPKNHLGEKVTFLVHL